MHENAAKQWIPADGARRKAGLRVLACGALLLWVPHATLAQPGEADQPVGSITRVRTIETRRQQTAEELISLSDTITLTDESIKALDAEIGAIASDRESIRGAMIEAAAAQKTIAGEIAATERRIGDLAGDEAGLKASLRSRRGLLAEVLGALERMGRKPPPALLVRPDDALGSVRSAILLGAVVPRIRLETDKLADDLAQLASVKREIADEKQRFVDGMTRQKEEEARLARLFGEKEKLEADSRGKRQAESLRAAELAAKATSLQDLIASLDAEAESARVAEEAAERAAEADRAARQRREAEAEAERLAAAERAEAVRKAEPLPKPPDEPPSPAPPLAAPPEAPAVAILPPAASPPPEKSYDIASLRRDMARLTPAAPFSTMKGRLTVPVSGELKVRYGDGDGIGRPSSGSTFAARAGDIVTAPADGQVLYSGPFRSYGQLLILDAGDGYHVVLAGMSGIDVGVGQFVLSGEPVAVMGAQRLASSAGGDFGTAEPSLYVEFRKDGKPVDPSPWWTERPSGRTRNDS